MPSTANAAGVPPSNASAIANNRQTVDSYEHCARDYAQATAPHAALAGGESLHRLMQALGPGSSVLEIGSGPGWDADFLEAQGAIVRRTDITASFLAFQHERGKAAERLDIIADELGGPYDGIVALYVLQHIDRSLVDGILGKIAGALQPGGVFLVALREGTGELCEQGSDSGRYHVTLWPLAAFQQRLEAAGLQAVWGIHSTDADGDWMTLLAKNQP